MFIQHGCAGRNATQPIIRQTIFPADYLPRAPFNCRVLHLMPGTQTVAHDHHDCEMWVILTGQGEVREDEECRQISAGDIIHLTPLGCHSIANTSFSDPLTFMTIWWEDMEALAVTQRNLMAKSPTGIRQPTLILPAFPTPNGDLHIGHLAGPYIGADIYRRALCLAGVPVQTLLGSLGHMNHIAMSAAKLQRAFYDTAEYFTDEIIRTLSAYNIEFDVFLRPTPSLHYIKITQDIFLRLRQKGLVIQKTGIVNFCESCDDYCFEAYVRGICPYCGRDASGHDCESCGRHHDDGQLLDPRCERCGAAAVRRPLERFYLQLEPLRQQLMAFYQTVTLGPQLRSFVSWIMSDELPEIPVSHVTENGVPLNVPGFENQRIYSCFEHAGRFLTAIQELCKAADPPMDWCRYLETNKVRLVVFFGCDNAYMRAVLFPSLLSAYIDDLCLPNVLIMNHFYFLEGSKFSTSRNHAIWGRELIEHAPLEAIRFYLALTRPEVQETNFTTQDFKTVVTTELIDLWQGWLRDVQDRLTQSFDSIVPEAGPWSLDAKHFYSDIQKMRDDVRAAYDENSFSPQRACRTLSYFVRSARYFAQSTAELRSRPALAREAATHMALELMAIRSFALLVAPVMPHFASRVLQALGYDTPLETQRWETSPSWIPHGRRVIMLGQPYFDMSGTNAVAPEQHRVTPPSS